MRHLALGSAVALAIAASACQPASFNAPAPPGDGSPADGALYPDGNPYRLLTVEELPVVGIAVDSALSGYPAGRAIDGSLNTEWASNPYRGATAWAAVELAQSAAIAAVAVKTGPLNAGASYDVQVSANGTTWTTALANQRNTTWNLEAKALPAGHAGKFVRLFFHNSASQPMSRFSVFEVSVRGERQAAPSPTPTSGPASPPPSPTPTPSLPPPATSVRLAPASVTASSSYPGLVPGRAIDGDAATQWGSNAYKAYEETLDLGFSQRFVFDQLRIKTGYLPPGVGYDVYTSEDGASWTLAAWSFTNTTWNLEPKSLYGAGRYLRVRFHNAPDDPIARFYVYELEVYGHAPQAQAGLSLDVAPAQKTAFNNAASVFIGGPYTVLNVEPGAYDDAAAGRKFPAMLHVQSDGVATIYARVTPENASLMSAPHGAGAGVTFLDTTGGLGDNAGSWIFSVRDPDADISMIEAPAASCVTTWNPAGSAALDLGPTVRRYALSAEYLGAPFQPGRDPGADPYHPRVVLVYRRPDGTRDFAIPGVSGPFGNSPALVEASGYVYAFYVTDGTREPYATTRVKLAVNP